MNFGDNMGELQRRIAATHEGGFRRKKTFEALAIQKGQKLIDLGCGGGQLVHEMALAIGETGLVYGLDPSSSQIHAAQEKCSEFKNVEFLQESAIKIPLKDGSCDGLSSIQALEYIDDVETVIAEAKRILKSGGRFASVSVLWDHWRFHGPDKQLNDRIHEVFRAHCPHQMLPFSLTSILERNGFQGVSLTPLSFINTHLHQNSFAYFASRTLSLFALKNGIPEEDIMTWNDQLKKADQEGRLGFNSAPVLTTTIAL